MQKSLLTGKKNTLLGVHPYFSGASVLSGVFASRHRAAGGLQGGVPPPPEGLPRVEVQEQETQRRRKRSEGSQIRHRIRSVERSITAFNSLLCFASPARTHVFTHAASKLSENRCIQACQGRRHRDKLHAHTNPPVFPSISGFDETPWPKNAAKRLCQILF